MNAQIILWQVVSAYAFALVGGAVSVLLRLAHKQPCALISFAAGTLLGVAIGQGRKQKCLAKGILRRILRPRCGFSGLALV